MYIAYLGGPSGVGNAVHQVILPVLGLGVGTGLDVRRFKLRGRQYNEDGGECEFFFIKEHLEINKEDGGGGGEEEQVVVSSKYMFYKTSTSKSCDSFFIKEHFKEHLEINRMGGESRR